MQHTLKRLLRLRRAKFFNIVDLTLTRISQGGIYDHLGGGYSRYSVDDKWLVPHFEKMLYDNAQLLDLLAVSLAPNRRSAVPRAGAGDGRLAGPGDDQQRRRLLLLARCRLRRARRASSTSGRWRRSKAPWATDAAAVFAQHYDVTPKGNFEGHNILNRLKDLPRNIDRTKDEKQENILAANRAALHKIRESRIRPGLDDKVLADWNGLMIAALVNAGVAMKQPGWIAMAESGLRVRASQHDPKGDRLGHSWREGRLLFPGLASDFAMMIRAALSLHEATGNRSTLDTALSWQAALDRHYFNCGNRDLFPDRRRRGGPRGAAGAPPPMTQPRTRTPSPRRT